MIYKLIRPLLFKLDPEFTHKLALTTLQWAYSLGLLRFYQKPAHHSSTIMGLTFPNRIGLAAGFDKNGDYIDALAALGFGFIEIGTITPKPQPGNPKPRLFRLIKHKAIINRMGFNNKGMNHAAKKLKIIKYKGILGINIGKNKETPNEKAMDDYIACFRKLAPFASYITINISSPNTVGLRDLQEQSSLKPLLAALKKEQTVFEQQYHRYVPLVVKISPDLTDNELKNIAEILLERKIDGVIATNTTIQRDVVPDSSYANEQGGLSGEPLRTKSTAVIKQLYAHLGEQIPIIASGGVMDKTAVQEKLNAGAKLVQVYSGLIYSGVGMVT